jgi:UDP-N-acetylglucosamine 2-epimerase (non-hydrolysing)
MISECYQYGTTKNPMLSIVMTTHNRKEQTLYTLYSFTKSEYVDKIKVVIVDDSTKGFLTKEDFSSFAFEIVYITITNKTWINPCMNYNLGFEKVNTPFVIIQNAEVFHCGDIIKHTIQNLTQDNYIVYDVGGSHSLYENYILYGFDFDYNKIYNFQTRWYQHTKQLPKNLHFLTAITKKNLDYLGGFDPKYANGACYDDDEFLFRIKYHQKLQIVNIVNETTHLLGMHQWHEHGACSYDPKYVKINQDLFTLLQKKTVVTITGIRPDFIRMSAIFKKLDLNFNHILIHTGQHYDELLSDVFFQDLNIRKPNFVLNTGSQSSNHFEQLAYLSVNIPRLFKEKAIKPDIILFLGDSNSVGVSFPLKKEGYKIGHIEAGMRSFDRRMLEEINRTVCDHCSDILFVYHEDYKKNLQDENIKNVFVVGNTIVEPCREFIPTVPKRNDMILVDIHRPENFLYKDRLLNIITFANLCHQRYNLPVKILYFKRLKDSIEKFSIDLNIEMINLMSYKNYLDTIYHCKFIISDSGTAQEEPALLNVPVVVPREFTERPQSFAAGCSIKLDNYDDVFSWLDKPFTPNVEWLGNGQTSDLIISYLTKYLN